MGGSSGGIWERMGTLLQNGASKEPGGGGAAGAGGSPGAGDVGSGRGQLGAKANPSDGIPARGWGRGQAGQRDAPVGILQMGVSNEDSLPSLGANQPDFLVPAWLFGVLHLPASSFPAGLVPSGCAHPTTAAH